jgi:hypothetical protein
MSIYVTELKCLRLWNLIWKDGGELSIIILKGCGQKRLWPNLTY